MYACDAGVGDANHSWGASAPSADLAAYTTAPREPAARVERRPRDAQRGRPDPNATVPAGCYTALTFRAPPGAELSRIGYTTTSAAGAASRPADERRRDLAPRPRAGICGSFVRRSSASLSAARPRSARDAVRQGPSLRWLDAQCLGHAALGDGLGLDYTAPLAITGGSATTPGWKRGTVDSGIRARRQRRDRPVGCGVRRVRLVAMTPCSRRSPFPARTAPMRSD